MKTQASDRLLFVLCCDRILIMKSQVKHTRKITAVVAALSLILLTLFCLFSSGCGYSIDYEYKIDYEGGEGYYVVSTSGNITTMKGELEIPATYGDGVPVKEIASEAFRGSGITKLVLPATITKVGVAAFANCSRLEEVVFKEGIALEEIPKGMFGFDVCLTKMTIPDTVKTIGYRAFVGCENLETVTLSQNLETITEGAFEDCFALRDITFPEGLVSIGSLAFYGCDLREVIIPDSVHDTEITITDEEGNSQTQTVYGLDYGAFHTCRALKKAVVGSGITQIRAGVFGYCDSLEEIYIPLSVKKIEGAYFEGGKFISGHAFHNCNALATVNYAGTAADWGKIDINNEPHNDKSRLYNNSALFKEANDKLNFNYNTSYTPSV